MNPRTKTALIVALGIVFLLIALATGGCNSRSASNDDKSTKATTSKKIEVGKDWKLLADKEEVFGGTGQQKITDVVVAGPGLVAVGVDVDKKHLLVWTSKDAINWTRVAPENFEGGVDVDYIGDFTQASNSDPSIATGPSGLVVAARLDIWLSQDGLKWRKLPKNEAVFGGELKKEYSTKPLSIRDMVVSNSAFVAVGNGWYWREYSRGFTGIDEAITWFSQDGNSWERIPRDKAIFGGGTTRMHAVATDGSKFVAVGDTIREGFGTDAVVWTSPDGKTWTRVSDDEKVLGDQRWQHMIDITVGPSGFVAIGGESTDTTGVMATEVRGAVWTSPDGVKWTRVPHKDEVFGGDTSECTMKKVIAGGPGYTIIGQEKIKINRKYVAWLSKDGVNWKKHSFKEDDVFRESDMWQSDYLYSAVSFRSGLVAVGSHQADGAVWVSGNFGR